MKWILLLALWPACASASLITWIGSGNPYAGLETQSAQIWITADTQTQAITRIRISNGYTAVDRAGLNEHFDYAVANPIWEIAALANGPAAMFLGDPNNHAYLWSGPVFHIPVPQSLNPVEHIDKATYSDVAVYSTRGLEYRFTASNWHLEGTTASVPEPGTLALLALGLPLIWAQRRFWS